MIKDQDPGLDKGDGWLRPIIALFKLLCSFGLVVWGFSERIRAGIKAGKHRL